jgi:tight adherence protein C
VKGGCSFQAALDSISKRATGRHGVALAEARRRKDLGTTWARSLQMSDDPGLNQIGAVLQSSAELGVPSGALLRALAESMALQENRRFEAELKKAPVKMVVPLTVCILPAFGVLGAGPMLRGLIA